MTEDQAKMVEEILDLESGMTGKDMDFIEDLDRRRTEGKSMPLSDAQNDWLVDIWTRTHS